MSIFRATMLWFRFYLRIKHEEILNWYLFIISGYPLNYMLDILQHTSISISIFLSLGVVSYPNFCLNLPSPLSFFFLPKTPLTPLFFPLQSFFFSSYFIFRYTLWSGKDFNCSNTQNLFVLTRIVKTKIIFITNYVKAVFFGIL